MPQVPAEMKRLIISRTDNIGDVILTLPLAYTLKKAYPDLKILFLARRYVQAVVEACDWVDEFIPLEDNLVLPAADAIIHAYPVKRIAHLAKQAGIPLRIGTSHRWYHWLYCTQRISFSRARSNLHEAQLNFSLLKPFSLSTEIPLHTLKQMPLLDHNRLENKSIISYLAPDRFNLIIHPLSNGNGREWPINYFNALIKSLAATQKFHILITGSEQEKPYIQEHLAFQDENIVDLSGKLSLNALIALISKADGMLAASTGPLHVAAALGIHTLGLYAPQPLISPTRWAPIGPRAEFLVVNKNCDTKCSNRDCACLRAISVSEVKDKLTQWLSLQDTRR